MSKFKIAKQIPTGVLVKRMIKKFLHQSKLKYPDLELRQASSDYEIKAILSQKELPLVNNPYITHYINQEFNLLGSGWRSRTAQLNPSFKKKHAPFAAEIQKQLSGDYQLMDWQADAKTGYSFDVTAVSTKQKVIAGVDIKDVWEFGRLQHLPQLAFALDSDCSQEQLVATFKNQVLDFIGANPVGMGVQWACPMDVGIRVCNLLIAYDVMRQRDMKNLLNDKFIAYFTDSIYQHGKYIYDNIEHKEGAAGNHYLFNLVGLLFVGIYLSNSKEIEKWKSFAAHEFKNELKKQFFSDGGNFEGSTAYHCLSAEAMQYGLAILLRMGVELDDELRNKCSSAAHFIQDITKPTGEIPQFGDNDSGRLFKLAIEDENLLNYENVLAGFAGLFQSDRSSDKIEAKLYGSVLSQLAKGKCLKPFLPTLFAKVDGDFSELEYSEKTVIQFARKINLDEIQLKGYPDFGLYLLTSNQFYLAVSGISNANMHHSWGHVHNDKLSFELQVNGEDVVRDPGSYVYTSDTKERNAFRGTHAHHGIVVEGVEQNNMYHPFYLEPESKCQLVEMTPQKIVMNAQYYGVNHYRQFELFEDKIVISDSCNQPFKVNINAFKKYSPNYGTVQ